MKRVTNKSTMLYSILITLFVLAAVISSGCSKTKAPPTVTESTVQAVESESETVNEETPKAEALAADTYEITDMAGRSVVIPNKIDRVFSTSPVTAIYIYTINPEQLLGWNYELNDLERKYILDEYHDLPVFGMGDNINYEAVIEAQPEVAISVSKINEASIEEADRLSESLGIPVVIVSNDLEDTAKVYRFLGEILDAQEQTEQLAQYADKTFADIKQANIPDDQRVTVYYGNGIDSLETAPRGSSHAQIFDLAGAINVADLEVEGGGRIQVSLEQLLTWNPQFIITNGEPKQNIAGNDTAASILGNEDFSSVQAVQSKQVFGAPQAPFSWVDRPPGPNRIIGLRWLAGKLYPDFYQYDIDGEVKDFYQLFYHLELSDEALQELYND